MIDERKIIWGTAYASARHFLGAEQAGKKADEALEEFDKRFPEIDYGKALGTVAEWEKLHGQPIGHRDPKTGLPRVFVDFAKSSGANGMTEGDRVIVLDNSKYHRQTGVASDFTQDGDVHIQLDSGERHNTKWARIIPEQEMCPVCQTPGCMRRPRCTDPAGSF